MMNHIESAIIGMWRSGATLLQIWEATHVPIRQVGDIITRYRISLKVQGKDPWVSPTINKEAA